MARQYSLEGLGRYFPHRPRLASRLGGSWGVSSRGSRQTGRQGAGEAGHVVSGQLGRADGLRPRVTCEARRWARATVRRRHLRAALSSFLMDPREAWALTRPLYVSRSLSLSVK